MSSKIEAVLKHERWIVLAGLVLVTLIAWVWLLAGAGTGMNVMSMSTWQFPPPVHASMSQTWTVSHALVMFFMWWIMMIAMMTPSASPVILLYGHVHRHERQQGKIKSTLTPTFAFAGGYLVVWLLFSVAATALQWGLERAGLLHAMLMWSTDRTFSAAFLIAAGIYQLSPLKNVCLEHCRSPVQFLTTHYRPGISGALIMGLTHGAYCVGCCWLLMALLFVGGAMNLVWIAGLTILVLLEKLLPAGWWVARGSGAIAIAAGLWLLVGTSM